ncbi:MAG: hypothetical protein OIF56_15060 [Cohaesibacter sp.]|nr:hypothetical protein [Cohaesibacter sp.]
MDKNRIRERFYKHGNSLQRIALDYGVCPSAIASICGVTYRMETEPDWIQSLPHHCRDLAVWCCNENGVRLGRFFEVREGSGARSALCWHLVQRWGYSFVEVGAFLDIEVQTAGKLSMAYSGPVSPFNPEKPDLPRAYIDCLKNLARDHDSTPRAIFYGKTKVLIELRRDFIGLMVCEYGLSSREVARTLNSSSSTVLRCARYVRQNKQVRGVSHAA